ncbi:MAG TPA: ribonuclease HII [Clostridiaceae bacterium]|nr:ribonuclease HII [Clostridiaceae bacterium]
MRNPKLTQKEIKNRISHLDPLTALNELHKIRDLEEADVDKLIDEYKKKAEAFEEEIRRFKSICIYENEAYQKGYKYIAGVDEAGRGPLAGPVVAAAVILPSNIFIENLKDSKKLSSKRRDVLYDEIRSKALAFGIGMTDEKCIDEINILNATKSAMEQAINSLEIKPDIIFIDALKLDHISIPQVPITDGDNLSVSIAAASIIAKVTRDRLIEEYDRIYPQYGFAKHKGYGTKEHLEAIKKYGICPIHRMSFVKKYI